MRCIALFTGALDSLLAVRLMQVQGIEVTGLFVSNPLCGAGRARSEASAAELGMELLTVAADDEYCRLLGEPRLGRLQSIAPCLDCRVATTAIARQQMVQTGAAFVVSGEVVGQRPRTAVRDLEVVAHHAGLGNLLVRPLSAGLLPSTQPENSGWIDRSRLFDVQGKSRKRQHQLAGQLGLSIPPPRQECPLLEDPVGSRLRDLLDRPQPIDAWRLAILPLGRHVPLDADSWVVLGRNRTENEALLAHAQHGDAGLCAVATPVGFPGPTALIVGASTPDRRRSVARLIVQFGRAGDAAEVSVTIRDAGGEEVLRIASETNSSTVSSLS